MNIETKKSKFEDASALLNEAPDDEPESTDAPENDSAEAKETAPETEMTADSSGENDFESNDVEQTPADDEAGQSSDESDLTPAAEVPDTASDSNADSENAATQAQADQQTDVDGEFANLDLRRARCFGWEAVRNDCWYDLCKQVESGGWSNELAVKIESSLRRNVDNSYFCLASYQFVNLDDDVVWQLRFDNQKCLWKLQIKNSPDAEISPEQFTRFFNSELVKKTLQRTFDLITRAVEKYESIVKPHLEDGDLLDVDEVKLDAILHCIQNTQLLDNLKNGHYSV